MNDEEFGRQLPEMLGEVQLPLSTVDIDVAITLGRRRRRRPYAAGATAVLVLVAVAPIAVLSQRSQAPPQILPGSPPAATASGAPVARRCAPAERPAGFKDFVTDPSGTYLGGSYVTGRDADREFIERPAMWVGGKLHQLPLPPSQRGYLAAINERGVAVGGAGSGTDYATFAYVQGEIVPLAGGRGTAVTAINAAGVIVGTQIGRDYSETPVRWLSPASPLERLAIPSGAIGGRADHVTPRGEVIGTISMPGDQGQTWVPYRWDQAGKGRPLVIAEGMRVGVGPGNGDWVQGSYFITKEPLPPDTGAAVANLHTGEYRLFRDFVIEGQRSVTTDGWFIGHRRSSPGLRVLTDGRDSIVITDSATLPFVILHGVSADGKVVVGSTREGQDNWFGLIWRC